MQLSVLYICLQQKIDAIAVIEKMSTIRMLSILSIFVHFPTKRMLEIIEDVKAVAAMTIGTIGKKQYLLMDKQVEEKFG